MIKSSGRRASASSGETGQAEMITQRDMNLFLILYTFGRCQSFTSFTSSFIRIDYETGGGLDEVKQWISGRLCAFCGNSGVGKSTLLNHLLPVNWHWPR